MFISKKPTAEEWAMEQKEAETARKKFAEDTKNVDWDAIYKELDKKMKSVWQGLNDKQRNCNHSTWHGNHEFCISCKITNTQYEQHERETYPQKPNTPFRSWQLQKNERNGQ